MTNPNYNISLSGVITANITRAPIITTFTADKYYDKTVQAPLTWTLSGIYLSDLDSVTISSNYTSLFRDYNVNSNVIVDIRNISLYGSLASNYSINPPTFIYSNIYNFYYLNNSFFHRNY